VSRIRYATASSFRPYVGWGRGVDRFYWSKPAERALGAGLLARYNGVYGSARTGSVVLRGHSPAVAYMWRAWHPHRSRLPWGMARHVRGLRHAGDPGIGRLPYIATSPTTLGLRAWPRRSAISPCRRQLHLFNAAEGARPGSPGAANASRRSGRGEELRWAVPQDYIFRLSSCFAISRAAILLLDLPEEAEEVVITYLLGPRCASDLVALQRRDRDTDQVVDGFGMPVCACPLSKRLSHVLLGVL
jgi:hypothetical protein